MTFADSKSVLATLKNKNNDNPVIKKNYSRNIKSGKKTIKTSMDTVTRQHSGT